MARFYRLVRLIVDVTRPWRDAYLIEHWKEIDPAGASSSKRGGGTLEPGDLDQTDAPTRRSKASLNNIPEYHAVRTRQYLYVEYATGERELYDVRADSYELHNIVTTANPTLVRQLSAEVAALKDCRAASCRAAEDRRVP